MFKDSDRFNNNPTEVCYIPEGSDNEYTREDLIQVCKDFRDERSVIKEAEELVEILWDLLEWQHPETILVDLERESDPILYKKISFISKGEKIELNKKYAFPVNWVSRKIKF